MFSFFGRILFPQAQPWEQRHKMKVVAGTVFYALTFAISVGVVIYRHNSLHR